MAKLTRHQIQLQAHLPLNRILSFQFPNLSTPPQGYNLFACVYVDNNLTHLLFLFIYSAIAFSSEVQN